MQLVGSMWQMHRHFETTFYPVCPQERLHFKVAQEVHFVKKYVYIHIAILEVRATLMNSLDALLHAFCGRLF